MREREKTNFPPEISQFSLKKHRLSNRIQVTLYAGFCACTLLRMSSLRTTGSCITYILSYVFLYSFS